MAHPSPEIASVPESEPSWWQRVVSRLGFVVSKSEGEEKDLTGDDGNQTTIAPNGVDPHNGETMPETEANRERRAANRAEFAKRVPEPYILGPQAYTDPGIWIPEGSTKPIIEDEKYTETLRFLERMDDLVDAEPETKS